MDLRTRRALLGSAASLLATSPTAVLAQDLGLFSPRPTLPGFEGAVAWLNSDPLAPQDLRGRVVLVQFWTFTCVNWQRTLPYVAAWWAKYRAHGLAVVGVHTPEFSFEREVANVRQATAQLRIGYPVAVDSNQAVWRSFRNAAWPAAYIADPMGRIVFRHDGEGEYDNAEKTIQRLLSHAGMKDYPGGLVRVEGAGAQAAADWARLRSPETYTGHEKAENFQSPGGMARGRQRSYELPPRLGPNGWAVAGEWAFGAEAARSEAPRARLAYRFHARDVNLVMGAARRDKPVPFRVRIDGQPPGMDHGADVDEGGRGVGAEKRLYQLVRQAGAVREREVEIDFLEPGAEVYAFTFG